MTPTPRRHPLAFASMPCPFSHVIEGRSASPATTAEHDPDYRGSWRGPRRCARRPLSSRQNRPDGTGSACRSGFPQRGVLLEHRVAPRRHPRRARRGQVPFPHRVGLRQVRPRQLRVRRGPGRDAEARGEQGRSGAQRRRAADHRIPYRRDRDGLRHQGRPSV